MSKEIAHKFIQKKIESGRLELNEDEVYGIRLVLGVNATEFANILGIHKSTMSKILRGTLSMKKTECTLALIWLMKELEQSGFIKDRNQRKNNRKEDEFFTAIIKCLVA